ncbi:MAG: hypothetical protein HUU55_02775 [Myxococcales bacterium]|nr:hypothetical protein [Myxococcales bacterium]
MFRKSPEKSSDNVAYWTLMFAGGLVATIPLWVVEFVPLQDLPGHLATVRVLLDLDQSPFAETYFRPDWLLPNAVYFYLVKWLSYLLPIGIASKLVLSVYCLTLAPSLGALFQSCGRSRWLGLVGLLYVYNDPMSYGFVSFATGIPPMLFTIAIANRHAAHPTPKQGFLLAGLLAVLFLFHAQIFLQACLFGLVLAFLSFDGWKVAWQRIWPIALGSLPFLAWFLRFFVFPQTSARADVTFGGLASETGFRWASPAKLLEEMRNNILISFNAETDELLMLIVLAVTLVLLASRRRRQVVTIGKEVFSAHNRRTFVIEALTFVALLGFVALPLHMKGQALISSRLIPFAAMFLAGWGSLPRNRVLRVLVVATILVTSVWFHLSVAQHFRRYVRYEMGDFQTLMSKLDQNDRLAYLRPERSHRWVDSGASWYLDSYHIVLNGGLSRMPFHVIYPHHTVVYPTKSLPRVNEVRIQQFPASLESRAYTHVLVYSIERPAFGPKNKWVQMVMHTGNLWLYRIVHPEIKPRRSTDEEMPRVERRGEELSRGGLRPVLPVSTPWRMVPEDSGWEADNNLGVQKYSPGLLAPQGVFDLDVNLSPALPLGPPERSRDTGRGNPPAVAPEPPGPANYDFEGPP